MSMTCRPKWPFLLMCMFHDVRHVEFHGLTGSQGTPGFGASHDMRSIVLLCDDTYIVISIRSKNVNER